MISSLTNDGTFPDRPPESRNRGMVNRFKVNEEKRNTARTHNSHIFVRPKNVTIWVSVTIWVICD